jgi:uncharacterized membrane protein
MESRAADAAQQRRACRGREQPLQVKRLQETDAREGTAMWTRTQIASMVFMMVQPILFGIGMVLILTTSLDQNAMELVPWMIAVTFVVSAPLAWLLAPRLQMRHWRRRHTNGDFISG